MTRDVADHLHVSCGRCGKRALFEQPFEFLAEKPRNERRPTHQWGGWYVVEKYPNVLAWTAPSQSHQILYHWPGELIGTDLLRGVVKCEVCHHVAAHDLVWPKDAYYQWDIRGRTLWACSAGHALALRDYLASDDRDPARYGEFERSLRHLPKEFLTAKVRDEAVKRIARSFTA
jgi:hypothetical protein